MQPRITAHKIPLNFKDDMGMSDNMVSVQFEDMRYAKTIIEVDKFGRECEVTRGPIVYRAVNHNVVTDDGRVAILDSAFNLASTSFLFGMVGSGAAGGGDDTDPSKLRLNNELISGGPATRPGLTDLVGGSLVTGDVVSGISGGNRWLIVVQYVYLTTEFNTLTMNEYGLNSIGTLPGTSTTQSGKMLARFVAPAFTKTSAFQASIQWTLRT